MAELIINGAAPTAIYVGSTRASAVYLGNVKVWADPYNPLGLPPFTIRCQFSSGYTPAMGDTQTLVDADTNVWDITKTNGVMSALFSGNTSLLEVLGANFSGVELAAGLFRGCTNLSSVALFDTGSVTTQVNSSGYGFFDSCSALVSVPQFDFSSVTSCAKLFYGCSNLTTIPKLDISSTESTKQMFHGCTSLVSAPMLTLSSSCTDMTAMFLSCTSLTTVPAYDVTSVTKMGGMFGGCLSLETVPYLDTRNVTAFFDNNRGGMFAGCSALKSVPLFNTSSATTVRQMFSGCTGVESGALALYQQMSTQTNPPTTHTNTFQNCGADTVTGAAELAQIPTTWGGTMSTDNTPGYSGGIG